jgi:hypothetical protein
MPAREPTTPCFLFLLFPTTCLRALLLIFLRVCKRGENATKSFKKNRASGAVRRPGEGRGGAGGRGGGAKINIKETNEQEEEQQVRHPR